MDYVFKGSRLAGFLETMRPVMSLFNVFGNSPFAFYEREGEREMSH